MARQANMLDAHLLDWGGQGCMLLMYDVKYIGVNIFIISINHDKGVVFGGRKRNERCYRQS